MNIKLLLEFRTKVAAPLQVGAEIVKSVLIDRSPFPCKAGYTTSCAALRRVRACQFMNKTFPKSNVKC